MSAGDGRISFHADGNANSFLILFAMSIFVLAWVADRILKRLGDLAAAPHPCVQFINDTPETEEDTDSDTANTASEEEKETTETPNTDSEEEETTEKKDEEPKKSV
jgi:hypothetical protein